jgi:hypothetical protein
MGRSFRGCEGGLILWAFIGIVVIALIYLGCVAYDARHTTNQAPRDDMYTCDRHGVFSKKYALKLTGITEEPILQCPFCMEDRFKEAKQRAAQGNK